MTAPVAALLLLWLASPGQLASQVEPMRQVDAGGRPVAYHVLGGGDQLPLVVVNGGPGLDHGYLHLSSTWHELGRGRRVVLFDQPGTGQSGRLGPADSIGVEDMLASIEAIRGELKVEQLAVLGHSWGGYLAMAYAVNHPRQVAKLVLVGSAAAKLSETEILFGALFPDSLARGAEWRVHDPAALAQDLRRHLAMSIYSPLIRRTVVQALGPMDYEHRQAAMLLAEAGAVDLSVRVRRLAIPVLIGTGRFDANVSPRTAWRLHRAIPHSRFHVWEESGHYPMIEEPDQFVAVVSRFLTAPR